MPEKLKKEINKTSVYAKYTMPILDDLIKKNYTGSNKLYLMDKGYKVFILDNLRLNIQLPTPERKTKSQIYGIKKGDVVPYEDNKGQTINLYPLKGSKPLDKKTGQIIHGAKRIHLLPHQKRFCRHFINAYHIGCLLFHTVGSGKSLTAVAFAHYYLLLYPKNNVLILSPPSLLYNIIDEMRKYGLDIRDNRYKFQTYIKFAKEPEKYVNDKTLIIIDEAHYFRQLITYKMVEYEDGTIKTIADANNVGNVILQSCQKAHKILCMTGTPFINYLYDIENIMSMISKKEPLLPRYFRELLQSDENVLDYFKYKISHFDLSKNPKLIEDFPIKNEMYIPILLNRKHREQYENVFHGNNIRDEIDGNSTIDMKIFGLMTNNKDGKEKSDKQMKTFYNVSRQLSNILGKYKIKFVINKIIENPNYKTIIYTTFVDLGINIYISELNHNNIKFVKITGAENAIDRQKNKEIFNDENSGINVLLISKAGTEGVSTKGVRQFFLCESQYNEAISEQAIARAIRYKSHNHLPQDQRFCNIYRLILCVNNNDKKLVENINSKTIDLKEIQVSDSVDLLLTKICLEKNEYINGFIKKLDDNVPNMEESKQPFERTLMKILDKETNPTKIIELQRKIIDKQGIAVVRFNQEINKLIIESETRKAQEGIQKLQRKKGDEGSQSFFTPKEIAKELTSYSSNIKNKKMISILEPTAGIGNLIIPFLEIRNKMNDIGTKFTLVEINRNYHDTLDRMSNLYPNMHIVKMNFLQYINGEQFDIIIMNPPFHLKKSLTGYRKDFWDMDFVQKAYTMLETGGELISIIARDSYKKTKYKQWFTDVGGQVLKTYNDYKWKHDTKEAGHKNLTVNFNIIKITK